jgi:hypothetical protein
MKAQREFHCATCEAEVKRMAAELAAIQHERRRVQRIRQRELTQARLYAVERGVAEYDPEKLRAIYRQRTKDGDEAQEEAAVTEATQ